MEGWVSFHVVPGAAGPAAAEEHLRRLGLDRLQRSADGRIHVVAPRDVVERAFGCALVERPRPVRVGAASTVAPAFELPAEIGVPAGLRAVASEIIFPVAPDYLASSAGKARRP